jgi:hypothetical protein
MQAETLDTSRSRRLARVLIIDAVILLIVVATGIWWAQTRDDDAPAPTGGTTTTTTAGRAPRTGVHDLRFRPVLHVAIDEGAQASQAGTASRGWLQTDTAPTAKPSDASDPAWITPDLQTMFRDMRCPQPMPTADAGSPPAPDRPLLSCHQEGAGKFILGPAELDAGDIARANAHQEAGGSWEVSVAFTDDGARRLTDITTRLASYGKDAARNRRRTAVHRQLHPGRGRRPRERHQARLPPGHERREHVTPLATF